MERKTFIKTCGWACVGGGLMSAMLQGCAGTVYYATNTLSGNNILVKKSEFNQTVKDQVKLRRFVVVRSEKLNFPICIYKTGDDQYTALFMECTHKGCELQPHGQFLICPCHGSEFSNKGVVQNPPAEENLRTFQTQTDHENIYIQL